jgi:hypothetical protein
MFKYKIKNVLKFYIFTQITSKIVEDESHFMLHCKKDDILRVNLFQTLKDENEEFIELFEMEKIK